MLPDQTCARTRTREEAGTRGWQSREKRVPHLPDGTVPPPWSYWAKRAQNRGGISAECAWFCVKPDGCLALVRALRGDGEEFAFCRSRKGFDVSCAALS